MAAIAPLTAALGAVALLVVASSVPYTMTAIQYRRRDNGLAYLLLVLGVGVWNAMYVMQLLAPDSVSKGFFLALSIVGAVLSGLGWFLFATTASSTGRRYDRRSVYLAVSVLGGLDVVLAITAPIHRFYWTVSSGSAFEFAAVTPAVGYWLHTALLAGLFGFGAWLFAGPWRRGVNPAFSRTYTLAGVLVVVAVIAGNTVWPGGRGFAPLAAGLLTTTGWLQAARG